MVETVSFYLLISSTKTTLNTQGRLALLDEWKLVECRIQD